MLAGLSLGPNDADRFWDRYFGDIPLDNAVIFDPFVGGGTTIIEASRCNARVIGYDIDPVATYITRFELESPTWGQLPESVKSITNSVSESISPHHRTILPCGSKADVLHHFWVEVTNCRACGDDFEIHPHFLLAYDQTKRLQWAFCRDCHEIRRQTFGRKHLACTCGTRTVIQSGTLSNGRLICPNCRSTDSLSARGITDQCPPTWRLFAQEYVEPGSKGKVRKFKKATDEDKTIYANTGRLLEEVEGRDGSFAPKRLIPKLGRSDNRPLIHGFRSYRELFNSRQLLHLTVLGKAISSLPDAKERRLLGLAFSEHLSTNCMYAGYAFGYRRLSALFSIHSYRHITRPVELNPWMSGIGRGTFPNVLGKIKRAISFAKCPTDLSPQGGRGPASRRVGPLEGLVGNHPKSLLSLKVGAAIRTHTSMDLSAFPDESVDLVLTDPPYFDNISYSELSDFYLAWHQALGIAEPPYGDSRKSSPMRANLAVTAKTDGAIMEYQTRLTAILRECCRVLHPKGLCSFTYHHKSAKAWRSIGEALARSGLRVSSVLPLRGEGQGGLHSYNGTIKWDAVFVCRKVGLIPDEGTGVIVVPKTAIRRAADTTETFTVRLTKSEKIGFRTPDQLNLYRASIVAAARVGSLSPRFLTLEAALELPFEC